MKPEEFIANCLKTESNDLDKIVPRLVDKKTIRLLHASMGLITEGAEFLDALKKYIFYGKELDIVNLKEELGDSDWYQAIALDELGSSKEEIWEKVIAKLKSRYGDIFNEEGATNRNLEKEREILESEFTHFAYNNHYSAICGAKSGTITNKTSRITCLNCLEILHEEELANIAGENK